MTCLAKLGMSIFIAILKCMQATYNNVLFYVCPGIVCVCVCVCVCVGGWVVGWDFNSKFLKFALDENDLYT